MSRPHFDHPRVRIAWTDEQMRHYNWMNGVIYRWRLAQLRVRAILDGR